MTLGILTAIAALLGVMFFSFMRTPPERVASHIILFWKVACLAAAFLLARYGLWYFAPALFALAFWFSPRQAAHARSAAPSSGAMSFEEARALFNLPQTPTREDINAAYRRLMRENHPDRGGNSERAARINEARSVLFKHATL